MVFAIKSKKLLLLVGEMICCVVSRIAERIMATRGATSIYFVFSFLKGTKSKRQKIKKRPKWTILSKCGKAKNGFFGKLELGINNP